ncbi:hypothetical protein C0993_005067 [Termitomyces sp. T159_Od127]|nr:hypothetical protein C0993_005067 [Termitomyces sp. T159_Od127]
MLSQPVDPISATTHSEPLSIPLHPEINEPLPSEANISVPISRQKKPRKKRRGKSKINKWADRCMYAELLEMVSDPSEPWGGAGADGLPADLESGWVALAPVPQGKRCLAVTQSAADCPSHATLRSRLLGKVLLNRFPSVLPPHTILDCVLDNNWRDNGVLHVLDVIKWKGQDVSDCESAFRFWWRDTRLGELPYTAPPPSHTLKSNDTTIYTFPYPTTLLPVPYHTDTTLPFLLSHIVPSVRLPRSVGIAAPAVPSQGMDVDFSGFGQAVQMKETTIEPDGLLLYVKAASYESGTSPLSSWVPIVPYDGPEHESPLDIFERLMFKFDFTLDDADVDLDLSSQLSNSLNVSNPIQKDADAASNKINEEPFAEIPIDTLLEHLPNILSYSPLFIPILATNDSQSADSKNVTLFRRDLFDARFQLIAQENTTGDTTEAPASSASTKALAFVEAPSDLVPGIYEGGLKTWECSIDLAGYLAGRGPDFDARGKRIIEFGCGTAVPTLFVLRQLLSTSPDEATDTEIHLQDYNASVLELVSFPNVLLTWYTSPAAVSFRTSHPPPEVDEDTESANPNAPGDLFITSELKSAFLASLKTYKIHLKFFSGSWTSFPVAPYDIVLTSETIYRSESLAQFLALLKGSASVQGKQKKKVHLCLVAAKILYFGVGGGVEDFVARVKEQGGSVENVWEVTSGVGRRVMSVQWESI